MSTRTVRRVDTVLLLLMWTGALVGWTQLPERFPIHFDVAGRPDGWANPREAGILRTAS